MLEMTLGIIPTKTAAKSDLVMFLPVWYENKSLILIF